MIRILLAAAALLALPAAPSSAADKVSLRPGEMAIVVIDDGGRVSVERGGAARPMSDEDRAMVRDLLLNHPEAFGPQAALIRADLARPAPPVARGEIRFSFIALGERNDTLLIVENGYDRGLRYRAVMSRGSRSEPTDVCVVVPGRRGYEHWPYPIDRIDLGTMTLVPYREGDVPTCE